TAVPLATVTSHFDVDSPQSRPAPATVPGPVTAATRCTCAGGGGGGGGGGRAATKFAYTVASLERTTLHPAAPEQPAPQPSKLNPEAAAALSETEVPD